MAQWRLLYADSRSDSELHHQQVTAASWWRNVVVMHAESASVSGNDMIEFLADDGGLVLAIPYHLVTLIEVVPEHLDEPADG